MPKNKVNNNIKLKSGGGLINDANGLSVEFKSMFGGDGSDGVLNVTSGTTTLSLGGLTLKEFNYSSINISAGATLTFSDAPPTGCLIFLKCKGACVIDGTILTTGSGADGGAVVGANTAGNPGLSALSIYELSTTAINFYGIGGLSNGVTYGGAGAGGYGGTGGTGGGAAGGSSTVKQYQYTIGRGFINDRHITVLPGSGGGSGGVGNTNATTLSKGGDGGGAIVIECAGSLTFTGTVNTSGENGGVYGTFNGTTGSGAYAGSGGGGGSAGTPILIYNTLITNTGTLIATGGNGGNGDVSHGGGAGHGGGGGAGLGGSGGNSSGTTGGTGGATGTPTWIYKNTTF